MGNWIVSSHTFYSYYLEPYPIRSNSGGRDQRKLGRVSCASFQFFPIFLHISLLFFLFLQQTVFQNRAVNKRLPIVNFFCLFILFGSPDHVNLCCSDKCLILEKLIDWHLSFFFLFLLFSLALENFYKTFYVIFV